MSEMVERIAEVIWNKREARFAIQAKMVPLPPNRETIAWEKCMDEARAVIEATRVPTKEMKLAGSSSCNSELQAKRVWQAMVDEALIT